MTHASFKAFGQGQITKLERLGFWTIEWRYRLRGVWRSLRGDYPL